MVLSDYDLKQNADELVVPFDPRNVSPASIDLTLADSTTDPAYRFVDGKLTLEGGGFVNLSTVETVKVPEHLVGIVKGKSSIARLGVMVECAGFVDPGFRGTITLEVKNLTDKPIVLRSGKKICQIVYMELTRPAIKPYSAENGHHYQDQHGATPSYLA